MASDIPKELQKKLSAFDSSLTEVEEKLQPLIEADQVELKEKLESIDKAKLEIVGAYAINSLFWMYLNICGVNPKEHHVKQELERIQSYMNRLKEIQDKAKAPKLDKDASKRFIKNALWSPEEGHSKDTNLKSPEQDEETSAEKKNKTAVKSSLWKSVKKRSLETSSSLATLVEKDDPSKQSAVASLKSPEKEEESSVEQNTTAIKSNLWKSIKKRSLDGSSPLATPLAAEGPSKKKTRKK